MTQTRSLLLPTFVAAVALVGCAGTSTPEPVDPGAAASAVAHRDLVSLVSPSSYAVVQLDVRSLTQSEVYQRARQTFDEHVADQDMPHAVRVLLDLFDRTDRAVIAWHPEDRDEAFVIIGQGSYAESDVGAFQTETATGSDGHVYAEIDDAAFVVLDSNLAVLGMPANLARDVAARHDGRQPSAGPADPTLQAAMRRAGFGSQMFSLAAGARRHIAREFPRELRDRVAAVGARASLTGSFDGEMFATMTDPEAAEAVAAELREGLAEVLAEREVVELGLHTIFEQVRITTDGNDVAVAITLADADVDRALGLFIQATFGARAVMSGSAPPPATSAAP